MSCVHATNKRSSYYAVDNRYQCSYRTFERAGYASKEESRRVMLESVRLAMRARKLYREECQDQGASPWNNPKLALSLGAFGASCSPAQEFDGFYLPPYGPREYSELGGNANTYTMAEANLEQESIDALAQFHLERLLVFEKEREIWDAIDCIAFETIPLVREAKAICKAMSKFYNDLDTRGEASRRKPWWIGFVFPEGLFPEVAAVGDGSNMNTVPKHLTVADIVCALAPTTAAAGKGYDPASFLSPSGIAINCTAIEYLPQIIKDLENALLAASHAGSGGEWKPWLVVYPNGGDVYDPITQTWKASESSERNCGDVTTEEVGLHEVRWSKTLGEIVLSARNKRSIWGGIIVGGCCRTGPEHIALLKRELEGELE